MGSCHLPKRESLVRVPGSLSVTTCPRVVMLTEEVTLFPSRVLTVAALCLVVAPLFQLQKSCKKGTLSKSKVSTHTPPQDSVLVCTHGVGQQQPKEG